MPAPSKADDRVLTTQPRRRSFASPCQRSQHSCRNPHAHPLLLDLDAPAPSQTAQAPYPIPSAQDISSASSHHAPAHLSQSRHTHKPVPRRPGARSKSVPWARAGGTSYHSGATHHSGEYSQYDPYDDPGAGAGGQAESQYYTPQSQYPQSHLQSMYAGQQAQTQTHDGYGANSVPPLSGSLKTLPVTLIPSQTIHPASTVDVYAVTACLRRPHCDPRHRIWKGHLE
ncbi:hypothetical protein DFH06DRAFT_1471206 [Mycena polygramma]|nr:hypothetical protein DFH06DRAFT_1471206 [Mycena polygramma]